MTVYNSQNSHLHNHCKRDAATISKVATSAPGAFRPFANLSAPAAIFVTTSVHAVEQLGLPLETSGQLPLGQHNP
jgi:hypothetical protein